jgi:hypothetical protein
MNDQKNPVCPEISAHEAPTRSRVVTRGCVYASSSDSLMSLSA